MERKKCTKCGKEVYITTLGRVLENYNNTTLITHHCEKAPIAENAKLSE